MPGSGVDPAGESGDRPMEKALFASTPGDLTRWDDTYGRLYFGAEFCEHCLPSPEELDEALRFCDAGAIPLTLVTPYLTDRGMEKAKALITRLGDRQRPAEIVVNDLGLLFHLSRSRPAVEIVLGRLFSKQACDPRITGLIRAYKGTWEDGPMDAIKRPFVSARTYLPFFQGRGRPRLELSHVLQGIDVTDLKGYFTFSIYFPYVQITSTRYCPTERLLGIVEQGCDPGVGIHGCERECKGIEIDLDGHDMGPLLTLRGNTLFYRNPQDPGEAGLPDGIDRLVHQPVAPL